MPGTINVTLVSTGAADNAATFNTVYSAMETEINKHLNGTAYRHATSELDSGTVDDVATPPSGGIVTSATSVDNLQLRFAAAIARIAGGSGTWAARANAITPGTNDLASLASQVVARTSANTPLTMVSRSATYAESDFGAVAIGLYAGSPFGLQITGLSGNTNALLNIAPFSGGNVLIASTGAITSSFAITAASFIGPLTGNASTATNVAATGITGTVLAAQIDSAIARVANVPTNAGSGATGTWPISITGNAVNADRSLPWQKLQDLAPSGTGTTLVATVQGGTYLALVSSAIVQRVFVTNTITLIAPTTGNQWQAVYLDNAGTLQVNPGTIGGTKDTAPLPSGGYAVGWAFLPQNATAIYSTQADWQAAGSPSAKGYLVPANVNGGASGGGGGTSGAAITSPFAIWGSNAGLGLSANAQAVDAVLSGVTAAGGALTVNSIRLDRVRVALALLQNVYTDASFADVMQAYVSQNVAQLLMPGTGTNLGKIILAVTSTSGPVVVAVNGNLRKVDYTNAAAQQATTNAASSIGGGAAALMSVVADPTPAGVSYFNMALQLASSSVPAGQIEIGRVWWDGTAFYNTVAGGLHFPSLPMLTAANVRNIRGNQSAAPTVPLATTGTQLPLPGWTPFVLHAPVAGLTAKCNLNVYAQQNATAKYDSYYYVGYSSVVNGGSNAGPWTLAGNHIYIGQDVAAVSLLAHRSRLTRINGLPGGDTWFTVLYILTIQTVPFFGWVELDVELGT
jgi:hypothetical protein